MSKLAEFKALEAKLAEQLAQLDALKNDKELKREIEFEQKLRALLGEYDFSLRNVIAILDPEVSRRAVPKKGAGQRRARAVKIYINPKTNERVETKGGNHSVLKAWKAEHGAEAVESWLQ
ncbi:histone-like nucleoid-structuring protein, MvaT/MvaU family [Pseudomonas tohonis]|uniref:histone-like nucleoid-structuring protein, MvaT/MvaU family n=1 Tax=Pseudomonas tohonis TaxID=2725477 RepID=UPI001F43B53C|nr:histone-like nucleoid-structuring protein, MvaT/MvaU family [Pseudomonas tohonis]